MFEKPLMEGISVDANFRDDELQNYFLSDFGYNLIISITFVCHQQMCDIDSNTSLNSELSEQHTDINIYQRLIILFSIVRE